MELLRLLRPEYCLGLLRRFRPACCIGFLMRLSPVKASILHGIAEEVYCM
jgi:hypothetical protein